MRIIKGISSMTGSNRWSFTFKDSKEIKDVNNYLALLDLENNWKWKWYFNTKIEHQTLELVVIPDLGFDRMELIEALEEYNKLCL